jgi:hypothetical protein
MAFEGDWKAVDEFVQWHKAAEDWKQEFEVFEFVQADPNGFDTSGRVSNFDDHFVWSLKSWDTDFIEPGKFDGFGSSGGVEGWYLAKKPWSEGNRPTIEALKFVDCLDCGNGEVNDPDECETCDYEGTIWMRLEDTGWQI